MQMMHILMQSSQFKNLLLQFICLDKATDEYQESYLWNSLKQGQRFQGSPMSTEGFYACLCIILPC